MRLEDKALIDIRRSYSAAIKDTKKEMRSIQKMIRGLEKQGYTPDVALMMLRQKMNIIADTLDDRLRSWVSDATTITKTGQLQMAGIANQIQPTLALSSLGGSPTPTAKINWNYVPESTIQNFVGFASDGSPLSTLFSKIPNEAGLAIKDAISSGIAMGKNPREVAETIIKITDDVPLARANVIARTEMLRAARETSRVSYSSNDIVTGYTRQATQDERTCLACLALSGTFYKSDEVMPSHPNCRCVMIPKTKSWAEITGDESIPDTSVQGLSSDEIIAGLDDSEVRTILGSKRYALWQSGTPLSEMVSVRDNSRWGPTTIIKPIKDVA